MLSKEYLCSIIYGNFTLFWKRRKNEDNEIVMWKRHYLGILKCWFLPTQRFLRNEKWVEVESSRKMGLCKTEESSPTQRIFCCSLKSVFLDMLMLMEYTNILHKSFLQELEVTVIFLFHSINMIFFHFSRCKCIKTLTIAKNHFNQTGVNSVMIFLKNQ